MCTSSVSFHCNLISVLILVNVALDCVTMQRQDSRRHAGVQKPSSRRTARRQHRKAIRRTFPGIVVEDFQVDWPRIFRVLRGSSSHFAMVAIKTWTNNWATSSRYHDSKLDTCILGCPASTDHIAHYMCCVRLWRVVRNAASAATSRDPGSRMLMTDASAFTLAQLVIAYTTYHIIKSTHLDMAVKTLRSRDFEPLAKAAKEAAKATSIKYGESSYSTERC